MHPTPPMRRRRFTTLALAALPAAIAGVAQAADDSAAWAALRSGGAVVLFRHANAPGVGDPPGFSLADCRTQRNLDATGQAQARRLGERLKSAAVPVAEVWTSRWCRARDTATLFALNPLREVSAFDSLYGAQRDEAQTAAARQLLLDWRGPGTLVVVSHQINIRALTGEPTASAEGVVLKRDGDSLKVVGRIAPAP